MRALTYAVAVLALAAGSSLRPDPALAAPPPWYVNATTGNDANDCLTPSTACATIQGAINKASAGDTVNVAAGTYTENQITIAKALTLTGAGWATTIIDGGLASLASSGTVRISGNLGAVTVQGFTIRNAGITGGERFLLVAKNSDAPVTLSNNRFVGQASHTVKEYGAWIYQPTANGSFTITGNRFESMAFGALIEVPRGGGSVLDNEFSDLMDSPCPPYPSGCWWPAFGVHVSTYGTGNDIGALVRVNGNNMHDFEGVGVHFEGRDLGGTVAPAKFTNVEVKDNAISPFRGTNEATVGTVGVNLKNESASSAGGVQNAVVSGNTITGNGLGSSRGVQLAGLVSNNTIQNNVLQNLARGVLVFDESSTGQYPTGVVVRNNSLISNTFSIRNLAPTGVTYRVDASGNWFGSNSAAVVTATLSMNPGEIDYTPWLNSGTDTEPATPGFQGDFSVLNVNDSLQVGTTGRIQEATSLVPSGGTINVTGGTYTEQVVITKSLTLSGAGSATTTIQAPGTMAVESDGDGKAIVEVSGASTNASVSGFTVQGALAGVTSAIHVHGNATATINNNRVQGTDALGGGMTGHGITVGDSLDGDADLPGTATITNNQLSGFHRAGIVVVGVGNTATITNNVVSGAGPTGSTTQQGITIQDGATGSIAGNTVRNVAYTGAAPSSATGIFLWDSANSITITNNMVQESQTGVMLQATEGIVVSSNTITVSAAGAAAMNAANPPMGLWLLGRGGTSVSCAGGDGSTPGLGCATGVTLTNNTITGGGSGYAVRIGKTPELSFTPAKTTASLSGNSVSGWVDGVWVGPSSIANSVMITGSAMPGNSGLAVNNTDAATAADATGNWWGSPWGPFHSTLNPTGQGNLISGTVSFNPWYVNAARTILNSPAPASPTVSTPASPTSVSSVTLTVTSAVDSIISVMGGTATVTATATGSAQNLVVNLTPNTTNNLSITAAYPGGPESTAVVRTVVHDSVAPTAPTVVPPTGPVSTTLVALTVTAEAGSTVQILGGTAAVTATATGSPQNISVNLTPNVTSTLSVTTTDAAGNPSPATTVTVVQDSIAPLAPLASAAATLTSAPTVTLTVTAEAGSTIHVAGGAAIITATATGSAQSVLVNLTPNATNTLSVTTTDAAGNTSTATTVTVVQDSIAPGAPVVAAPSSPTSSSIVTLTVTAEAGSTIRVAGGTAPVTATASGTPQNVVVGLTSNASNTLSVTASDAAGNVSAAATVAVTQDGTAPAVPVVVAATTLTSASSVTLTVTAEAGATIRIAGGAAPVSAMASGSTQELVVGLTPNATNSLSVTATDGAGNVSAAATVVVTQDSTAPAAPAVSAPTTLTPASSVTLTITAEAESTIQLVGGAALVTATATGSAQSVVVSLTPNASNTLSATATDAAGNVSAAATVTVVQDSVPPAPPVVSAATTLTAGSSVTLTVTAEAGSTIRITGGAAPVTATATGAAQELAVGLVSNAGNVLSVTATDAAGNVSAASTLIVTQDSTSPVAPVVTAETTLTSASSVTLTVTAQAGSTIRVVGGAAPVTAVATGSPQSVVVGLTPNASNTLSITASDAAGNTSPAATVTVVQDSVAPAAPTMAAATTLTSASSVTLTITAEAASTIRVVGGATLVTATATGSAQELVVGLTPNATNALSVTATDAGGNTSAASTVTVTQDSTPPGAPVVAAATTLTSASSVTLTVTAEAGSTIQVIGGGSTVTATATGSAQSVLVSLTPNSANTLSVTATDAAGNVSAAATVVVTQDSTAPATPTVAAATTLTSASSVTLTITAEAGSTIQVVGGAAPVTATATGSAQNLVVGLMPNAANTLLVTVADAAGNVSSPTVLPITQDQTPPSPPAVGAISAVTGRTSVTLTVSAESGSTIRVTGGASAVTAPAVGASQQVVVTLTPNAVNSLSVTATDTAGNVSSATTISIRQDSTPPAAPTVAPPTSPTSASTVNLQISAEAGSTIRITGGWEIVTALATGSQQTIEVPLTPNTTNTLSVTATDAAGNESAAATVTVVSISTGPLGPTVSVPRSPTASPTVVLTVTAPAGLTIRVTGGATSPVTATATGAPQAVTVSLSPNVTNTLAVVLIDAAGNVSPPTTRVVVHDSLPPAAPTVSTPASPTSAPAMALDVTAEAGSLISVVGGALPVTATATGSLQSVVVPLTPNATNSLSVTATDAAGNVSTAVTRTVVRLPLYSQIRGRISAASATGVTVSATPAGGTSATATVGADGRFSLSTVEPTRSYVVSVTGIPGGPYYYRLGATGNATTSAADATAIVPGPNGTYIEMALLPPPAISGMTGGGDNSQNRTVVISGSNLETVTDVFLITGTQSTRLISVTASTAVVTSTVEAGTPVGSYRVLVWTQAGMSAQSAGTILVAAPPTPSLLPVITTLSQVAVPLGTSPTIDVGGTNFGGASGVTVNPGGITIVPSAVTTSSLRASLPSSLTAGRYTLRVTTPAGTGPSSPEIGVVASVAASAITSAQAITAPVALSSTQSLAANLTLTNEGVEQSPTAATASVMLPQGLTIQAPAGQQPSEILPPRTVPPPPSAPAEAVAVSVGSPTTRLELSIPVVLQLTTIGGDNQPIVYLYDPNVPQKYVLGGIDGVQDGVSYTPGGIVISRTPLGDGRFRYVMAILLDHLSTYITSPETPVPTISSISPSATVTGGGDFTLTVFGSNFVNSSVVLWNGSSRTTGFVSSGQLTTTIPSAAIATTGKATVAVKNPPPGGGTSGSLPFEISPRAQVTWKVFLPFFPSGGYTGW